MTYTEAAIGALAQLRHAVVNYDLPVNVKWAINILDDAGVFAALDEQTDYASAVEVLTESALADVARRQGMDEPLYGNEALAIRDALRADEARRRYADSSREGLNGRRTDGLWAVQFQRKTD